MRYRGHIGLGIIVLAEVLLFGGVDFVARWFTPIVWTGYILLMDRINHRLAGESLLMDHPRAFLRMIPLSIVCWTIFEVYNLHLHNWEYIELPENLWVRYLGYGLSFATIFPGIFQTYVFIDRIGIFRKLHAMRPIDLAGYSTPMIVLGAVCMVLPVLLPGAVSGYLFALVWIGMVFLLEPINDRLGFRSLIADMRRGNYASFAGLFAAGIVCGLLWEFWNYWAVTKWIYTLPFPVGPHYFEMPLVGFLGFLPFAIECYSMYTFCEMRVAGYPDGPVECPGRAQGASEGGTSTSIESAAAPCPSTPPSSSLSRS